MTKEKHSMRRRTKAIIATAISLAVIGGLAGGALYVKGRIDAAIVFPTGKPAVVATSTPSTTPTPKPVPIGGILDEETALDLRREMPDNGDFAYKLPDGRWMKTNRLQPMPAEVMAAEQTKADAVPMPSGTTVEDWKTVRKNATNARGQYTYSTGRNVVLILEGIQGHGGGNYVMWQMEASLNLLNKLPIGGNGFDTAGQATAEAQKLIATMPDAPTWDIIVAHQH